MRMITDKMYFDNYRFVVEFDSGSETGPNQLTVWVAEKADIDAVPLKQFVAAHLLSALIEPERSRLHAKLEEEQRACQQPFELEIASLQQPYRAAGEKQGQRMPEKVKRRSRKLLQQMKSAMQRLEVEFAQRELWSLDRQWYDRDILQAQSRVFGEEFSLRDFYFEEANGPHIRNFCRKFALEEAYRQQVLTGETRWARRNALFVRNLLSVVGEDTLLSNGGDDYRQARDFFRWVDAHVEEILALPEYQRLKEEDSAFQPSAGEPDLLIRPAVEVLNHIPGVTTRFSCQGVSGRVRLQGRELLVVSPHEKYAYVSFSELGQPARDANAALLPSFPSVTSARIPCNFASEPVLRSTGNNFGFREELVELAERVLASADGWSVRPGESGPPAEGSATAAVGPEDGPVPGGIPPSRLAWLCRPERIERTLHLLFSFKHWAKARERLLYADRQGLYWVKAAVVQQACAAGLVSPVSYIDGSAGFARIMGHQATSRADIEALDAEGTKAFLQEHPLGEILRELGVDVAAVCPYRLTEKQEYVSRLARRYPSWDGDEKDDDDEEKDWDDEDWEVPSRLEGHRHEGERAPGTCPLCGGAVGPGPAPRIGHWRQSHRDQDLTVSQVVWLLGKSKADVKSPSAAIQPDYRGRSSSQAGNGTRFWRLETLETAVRQGQACVSEN
jgi:hypothetical protein